MTRALAFSADERDGGRSGITHEQQSQAAASKGKQLAPPAHKHNLTPPLPPLQSTHGGRVKETEGGVGAENMFEVHPVAGEEQKMGGGGAAPAARGGESPKGKRGGWLSQSVDLSSMSRCPLSRLLHLPRVVIVCDAWFLKAFSIAWSGWSSSSFASATTVCCSRCVPCVALRLR